MKKIKEFFDDFNIDINQEKEEKLYKYYEYLIEQNKLMNLTAITEYEDVIIKHFIDSAFIKKVNVDIDGKNIADIGSGAGFPGLVLAILYPKSNFTLIDSLNKRVEFLKRTVNILNLKNVKCFHIRGEDYFKKYNHKFDVVLSRAVARMNKLIDYTLPLTKKNGLFIAYKGIFEEDEEKEALEKLKKYRAKYENIQRFDFYGKRSFVIIKKGI